MYTKWCCVIIFILAHGILLAQKSNNYVEIKLKDISPNNIQLFWISSDSINHFSEEQSYWHKLEGSNDFQLVTFNLRDVSYQRFRLDMSTEINHEIEIEYIEIHVNGKNILLRGIEILDFFEPSVFFKLLSWNNKSIIFKTVEVEGMTDPGLHQISNRINQSIENNTTVELNLTAKNKGILAIELFDENYNSYGQAIIIDSSTSNITFKLNLEKKPKKLYIQPSTSNENTVAIIDIILKYNNYLINWEKENIGTQFTINGDYYNIDIYDSMFYVQTKIHKKYSTFALWIDNIEFPRDKKTKIIRGLLVALFIIVFLFVVNHIIPKIKLFKHPS